MWAKGVKLVDNDDFDLVMQTDANDVTLPTTPDAPAVPYASVVEAVFHTADGATPMADLTHNEMLDAMLLMFQWRFQQDYEIYS